MNKKYLLLVLALAGFADSLYLTYDHFQQGLAPCGTSIFSSCNAVLASSYAVVYGIPLALLGVIHYTLLFVSAGVFIKNKNNYFGALVVFLSYAGIVVSAYLMYLQAYVIQAYCIYCIASALLSLIIFILVWQNLYTQRKFLNILIIGSLYKYLLKPILFRLDPEKVHESFISIGESVGGFFPTKILLAGFLKYEDDRLAQEIEGLKFSNPIGLAAGFDYDAKLTQTLDGVGFGFHTVGTVTNMEYEGNPQPRLGRLPKSRSLMVNKGFKSESAEVVIKRLFGKFFNIPLGVSIGRTNSPKLKTQKDSVKDIVEAFTKFESLVLNHDYYELNISCPNLFGNITFYPTNNLKELLKAVEDLKLSKPVFVKMPIEKDDKEVLRMLKVIAGYRIQGVIFGNLQKDRGHKTLVQEEVKQFKTGNFSGKPTYERSNELISLAYKHYKDRFVIIGCGGVFSAEDAYEKIKRGANLVQMITGMVYEGPQMITRINIGLGQLLERDGYKNISEAVGSKN